MFLLVCAPPGPLEGETEGVISGADGGGRCASTGIRLSVIEAAAVGLRSRRQEHRPPPLLPDSVSESGF